MKNPDQIIDDLQRILDEDDDLAAVLSKSLDQARERAASGMDAQLRDALPWPSGLPEYYDYLRDFARWIPRQTDDPAWRTSAPEHRYAQEVKDRLGHFFWLVDQEVGAGGHAPAEGSEAFRRWLTEFAHEWGGFLDTPESFDDEILQSFLDDAPEYTLGESLVDGRPNSPSGWLTFNQFFARELNAGLRPIAEPTDNRVVTSPADCMYQHRYDIDADSNIPQTQLKQSSYGSIGRLLEGSRYADAFAGGTFVHYMLPPSAYHRYHLPVSGGVEESFVIRGEVYMQVELEDGKLVSKDNTETGYEFFQERGVVTLDTAGSRHGDLGIVAVVPVGMSHVASVNLTTVEGTQVAKGEEFGYFQFGGSDIVLLFQDGVDVDVDTGSGMRKVGTPIARATHR